MIMTSILPLTYQSTYRYLATNPVTWITPSPDLDDDDANDAAAAAAAPAAPSSSSSPHQKPRDDDDAPPSSSSHHHHHHHHLGVLKAHWTLGGKTYGSGWLLGRGLTVTALETPAITLKQGFEIQIQTKAEWDYVVVPR